MRQVAQAALARQGVQATQLLVTPTPFNTLLWRVVAVTPEHHLEGFRSLLEGDDPMHFDRFDRGLALAEPLRGHPPLVAIERFSQGFYKLTREGDTVVVHDLRMGQEPAYVFAFGVGQGSARIAPLSPPTAVGGRGDAGAALRWLWPRMWGEPLPPPRLGRELRALAKWMLACWVALMLAALVVVLIGGAR